VESSRIASCWSRIVRSRWVRLDETVGDGAQVEVVSAQIGLDGQADSFVHRADLEAVLDVLAVVIALGEAEEILLLHPLDVIEGLGVAEEDAGFLEGE
jgi:hypothetical protein